MSPLWRKNYVYTNYNLIIQKNTEFVADKKIQISINETYNTISRFVANVVIGIWGVETPRQFF